MEVDRIRRPAPRAGRPAYGTGASHSCNSSRQTQRRTAAGPGAGRRRSNMPNHVAESPPAAATDSLPDILRAAREELQADTLAARGGSESLARYSGQIDRIVRQIYRTAREETDAPVAVVAVGGYGRRQMCLHSDVDLLFLFGPLDPRRRRALPEGHAAPAVGPALRRRTPRARDRRPPRGRRRQPGVPRRAHRRAPARRRRRPVRAARRGLPGQQGGLGRRDAGRAARADRAAPRPVQPHALPPGARRQERAGRAARRLRGAHDPAPAAAGRAAAVHSDWTGGRSGGLPAAHPFHRAPQAQPQPERAHPRPAGRRGRAVRLADGEAGATGRGADEHLLPPRPHRQPGARQVAQGAGRRIPRGGGGGDGGTGTPRRRHLVRGRHARITAAACVAAGVRGGARRGLRRIPSRC